MGLTYKDAGVDIDAGNEAVEKIKPAVAGTWRPGVLGSLGGFGGLFALDVAKYPQPVLVSGTDGVGTKLRLAFQMDRHDTIGQDAVAMCVNDILVQGAEPLYFLDYLATGKVRPDTVASVVQGIAEGCKLSGCALIGGETAEMPGFYGDGEYDIAGFAVGVVNQDRLIDGSRIKEGDLLLALPSSGLHSNGYSLVRKIFTEEMYGQMLPGLDRPLGEVLLTPTRIYARAVAALLAQMEISGMVHITGGGLTENIPRVLPVGLGAKVCTGSWEVPAVFRLLQAAGEVEEEEMFRTFNMGIGYVIVIPPERKERACGILAEHGESWLEIGCVAAGTGVSYVCA